MRLVIDNHCMGIAIETVVIDNHSMGVPIETVVIYMKNVVLNTATVAMEEYIIYKAPHCIYLFSSIIF